jgi:type IV secretory pathway VirB2 component (pilin)
MYWVRYFSRKLALVVGCDIICTLLLWFGKLESNDYALIVLGTVGAYIAGNVVQKQQSLTKEEI